MNCAEVQDLLSAYHDGELTGDRQSHVNEHLNQCPQCKGELTVFARLSALARDLVTPTPPESIWRRLETELNEKVVSQPPRTAWYSSLYKSRFLAIAATVLVALGLSWFAYGNWFGHGDHHDFSVVFGHYLDEFHRDPNEAQQMLVAKYKGKAVDAAQAVRLVGYRPATANRSNEEYKVKSTYVLTMPCCTCVQTICERSDGSTVAIFEHDDENPKWFGDRRGTMENCSGKRCRLFDANDRIAASWQSGARHITVVGVRDVNEISDLVTWLEGNQQDNPS